MKSDVEKVMEIFKKRSKLFEDKNADYGNSWKKTGEILHHIFYKNPPRLETAGDFIAFGVITRMLDKMIRYSNLRFHNDPNKINEVLSETIGDLGVYAFMLESLEK